jgi:hypothetical protein
MPIIQRREHQAKNIEQLIITCLARDLSSVSFILLLPVDIPYFEKWITVVKGLPKLFEILFGVAIEHARPLLCLLSFISGWIASVEIPFQRSFSAHVQSYAMRSTTKQLGVPQLKRNYIQTLPL